ncbi:MAG: metal ABC transporter permease [Thermoanaerobaculia bacterium]
MNAGRFVGASVVVFVVRTLLNYVFYGVVTHGQYEEISAAHPGIFREVIPAYITIDLVAAFLLTYLIVRAASAFGGGIKGGVTLGVLIAILAPVIFNIYYFFSTTFYTVNMLTVESVYQIVSHAIQGALAAAIYKTA